MIRISIYQVLYAQAHAVRFVSPPTLYCEIKLLGSWFWLGKGKQREFRTINSSDVLGT